MLSGCSDLPGPSLNPTQADSIVGGMSLKLDLAAVVSPQLLRDIVELRLHDSSEPLALPSGQLGRSRSRNSALSRVGIRRTLIGGAPASAAASL